MKKIYYFLTTLVISLFALNTTETFAQCAKSTYGISSLGQPPCGTCGTNPSAQTSVGPGEYVSVSVVAGVEYCFSTCGTTWDTQLTGYNGNTAVFYNNDNGFDCNPSPQASILWTSTFTGTLDIMVNKNNCLGYQGSSSANSAILKYKQNSPTITSSSADICPGQCVSLTASQPGGTWSISPNDGSLSGTQFCPTTAGITYTITYVLAACTVTQTINVIAPSVAPTAAVALPASICTGGGAILYVTGGSLGPNSDWAWYSGGCGVGPVLGTGSSLVVQPSTTTTYYVRAEGGCGPTACATVTLPVNTFSTDPTSVTATQTTLCAGTSTTLTVNGGSLGSGSSWFWYSGSCGGILIGSGTSITVSPIQSTTYYVRAEGPCNTTACVSIPVTVSPAPQVGFGNIIGPSACGASDGCITVIATGGVPPYTYTFNNVNSPSTVCNLPAGPYVIRVTDASGCQAVTSVSLSDPGATPATVASSDQDNIICQGDAVTFTASGSYLYNYYVNGILATSSNPWTTTGLNNGDIIHVVALDYNFCSYTTQAITMTVNPVPVVTMTSVDPSACGAADGSVTANVSNGQPAYNFLWTPPVSTTLTAISLPAGPYYVTVTDQNGCSGSAIAGLSDPGAAPVTLISSDDDSTICAGENVDFTATGSVDYTFYVNGVITQGPGTPNVYSTTTLANNNIVISSGTDINGCTDVSNYFTVTVNPGPNVVLISSDLDNSICVGDMVTFTGTGALYYQFFINGVSQGPPGINNVIQSNTLVHGDVITVEGTDTNHCIVSSAAIIMTVNPPPVVTVTTVQNPSSCGANDGLVIVTASGGTPGYDYLWNSNIALGNAPNLTGLYAGPYYVEVTDDAGCQAHTTASLSDVGSSPVFLTSSDADSTICAGESVTLTATGATTYVFYIDGVVASTNNPFTLDSLQDGQGVTVVGLDTLLCSATSSVIEFTVHPSPFIQITTISNPTACGANDGYINTNTYGGTIGTGYTYTWNGGLPDAPNNTNLSAGPYTVIVTDANGCTDQASASLSDIGAPLVTITSSDPDLIICGGDTITFTGLAIGGTSPYSYNFYINGTPNPGTPDIYTTSALLNNDVVAATGTDFNGCTGTSQSLTFYVTPTIIPTLSAFADVCEDLPQILLTGGSPTGGTYTAMYDTIPITSVLFFPFGIGDGSHPITYTYDNGNGCFTTATGNITVLASPVVNLGADIEVCDSAVIVGPSGYVGYSWFPDGETTESIVVFNSAHVSLEVTDSAGCVGTGDVLAVINHAPQIHITASGPTEMCMGDTVELCLEGVWSSILWNTGSTTQCIYVYQNDEYFPYAEDPNGCADSILVGQGVLVTVHDPQPTISVVQDEFFSSEYETYQWYFNGAPVADGTNQTYHADSSGNYYVIVTDQWGCTGQSAIIEHTCVCVGIDEHSLNYTLEIFPNPTNGVFTIDGAFELPVDMRLELTNVLGQPVIQVEDVENTQFIRRDYNLNHLSQGVYIFTIKTDNETIVRRIVKN